MTRGESKRCAACGRPFEWRPAWARTWAEMRYCSAACRDGRDARARARHGHDAVETAIIDLLARRAPTASICPSEVARAIDPRAWRERMDDVRAAATRLAARGEIRVTQGEETVDPVTATGALRLRHPVPRG